MHSPQEKCEAKFYNQPPFHALVSFQTNHHTIGARQE
jgi:hypothetical protein